MFTFNGSKCRKISAIALFILLNLSQRAVCQHTILDSTFTFRAGVVKTGNALDIISSQCGYSFTYDSRLVNAERKTEMRFSDTKLSTILKKVLSNDSLFFSVIDKYIIISKAEYKPAIQHDSLQTDISDYITGTILDEESKDALPFATIGLKHKGKGTVSNINGEFGLNLSSDLFNDTLFISYLGYFSREIPVQQALGNNLSVTMKREFISIPEIIIRNQIPQEIISRARREIPVNYGNTPAYLTGFYREGVLKKDELQTYSEAVIKIFKSSYSGSILGDQIKVYKSRKVENIDRSDTVAVRLKAGLSTCLDLDGAKKIFDFITVESFSDYIYRMTDIVTYNDETAFVIEFEQKPTVDLPLFKGTLYINSTDYAILNAEFELNEALIHKMKDSFVTSSKRGFNTWPTSVKYTVSYRKINERYFLSHVRGDLKFVSKQKRKLFNSQFIVFFELAITDTDLQNVTRFDREETAPIHSVFSSTIKNYDKSFWGNQDFLRPEDNLLQALKNMNVKLQEFSK